MARQTSWNGKRFPTHVALVGLFIVGRRAIVGLSGNRRAASSLLLLLRLKERLLLHLKLLLVVRQRSFIRRARITVVVVEVAGAREVQRIGGWRLDERRGAVRRRGQHARFSGSVVVR